MKNLDLKKVEVCKYRRIKDHAEAINLKILSNFYILPTVWEKISKRRGIVLKFRARSNSQ